MAFTIARTSLDGFGFCLWVGFLDGISEVPVGEGVMREVRQLRLRRTVGCVLWLVFRLQRSEKFASEFNRLYSDFFHGVISIATSCHVRGFKYNDMIASPKWRVICVSLPMRSVNEGASAAVPERTPRLSASAVETSARACRSPIRNQTLSLTAQGVR